MEIVLSNLSLIELKAHAYDEIQKIEVAQNTLKKIIETSQNNLRLLNAEIVNRANTPQLPVEKPEEKLISFDDFSKMDIRIGTILTAERVEGTDKLMKLSVDLGYEVRTIVSGIAHVFSVEDVVNKRIQVLVNLAPRKIKGIESKGMILFADNGEGLAFVSPLGDVPNGAGVR